MRNVFLALAAFIVTAAPALPVLAEEGEHHHGDFIIGRTAGNQLVLDFDTSEHLHLEPIVPGPPNGWSAAEPGFDDLGADEPGEGIFTIDTGVSDIEVVFTSIPDAFFILDGLSAAANPYALPEDNHKHLTFLVNADDADFDPAVTDFPLSFYFTDTQNTYSDSPTYTVVFTTEPEEIPEPASLALLTVGGLALLRRRSAKH